VTHGPGICVLFEPAARPAARLAGATAVVIDAIRATTTIVAALAAGAREVVPCRTEADVKAEAARRPAGSVVTAGERGGRRLEGLDLNNSPSVMTAENLSGRTLLLTTTNGTQAIHDALSAEAVLIAEVEGKPIGFALTLPDINILLYGLNGRMFPFGFIKLLWGLPRLRQYRFFGLGVHPDYHGLGIDSLLYARTWQALARKNVRVEIDYVLEDNVPMNNALKRLGVKYIKAYRVYEMAI